MFRIQSQLIRIQSNVFHNRYLKNTGYIFVTKTSNKDFKVPGEHPAFKMGKCLHFSFFWRHFGFPEFETLLNKITFFKAYNRFYCVLRHVPMCISLKRMGKEFWTMATTSCKINFFKYTNTHFFFLGGGRWGYITSNYALNIVYERSRVILSSFAH